MQFQKILAVAVAEMRSVRRLVRTWIFSILSVGITMFAFLYYGVIHGIFSAQSATIGSAGPRFLMSAFGIYLLGIFLVGIIFLAFDVRARDQRERIAEVLDARPISNLELLVGRMIGLTVIAWLPVLAVAFLTQTLGTMAHLFDWFVLDTVEPYSLLGFMFVDVLSSLALWCAMVIFLAVSLRNRLLVTVLSFVLLGLQLWLFFRTPLYLLPSLSSLAALGSLASDVMPSMISGAIALQRICLWILASGLLVLAAALHPRPDSGSKPRKLLVGGVLVVAAFIGIGTLATRAGAARDLQQSWLAAHEAAQNDPRPEIQSVTGTVEIEPGSRLGLDIEMVLTPHGDATLDSLLLSFNPGMEITGLDVGGTQNSFRHELGLLDVELAQPLRPGTDITLSLRAEGRPDPTFAYLDSSQDLLGGTSFNSQIALLGTEGSVFDKRYVALLPGLRWLPRAGSGVPTDNVSQRPVDFFTVDIEVEVPEGWLVAGPGRREVIGGAQGARFRFHPGAPVPDLGLLASRFERRAVEVAGVELELLMHPKHMRNVEYFADASDAIVERLREYFTEASELGLPYPYDALSMVETPAAIRAYGGDWRMDSIQALPGVMMLREHSFPTSRFQFEFRNPDDFENREGGLAGAKVAALERFFANDFSGGNPFLGVARNFVLFQTGAEGPGAAAIDFVCLELTNQLLTRTGGFFSAHIFDSGMGMVIGKTITNMVSGRTDEIGDALLSAAADRPSVWDLALGSPLADIDPYADPKQTLNVMALKGKAIARSILDGLGREKTAELLAELRRRHGGGNFSASDFEAVAADVDANLAPLIGDWLHDASLPGFLPSPVEVTRLADDDQGRPRYQTRVHIHNDEPTPGLLRMRYATGAGDEDSDWHLSDPIRIEGNAAIEVGLLSSDVPQQLWLQPYLSMNRQEIRLELPSVDQEESSSDEPFLGTRPSEWLPSGGDAIVVDDLDSGFSVATVAAEGSVRLDAAGPESGGAMAELFFGVVDLDQGLPQHNEFGPPPREWVRRETASSWGKYRHTIAMTNAGDGDKTAVFETILPHTGRWHLEYYMPILTTTTSSTAVRGARISAQVGLGGSQGTYDMKLDCGGGEKVIEFDGSVAEPGWNRLGEFDVTSPEVRVSVSNETSGRVIIADAVRWVPVNGR